MGAVLTRRLDASGILHMNENHRIARSGMKDRRSTWEIRAVIATALLHPVFVDLLHQRAVFIYLKLVAATGLLGAVFALIYMRWRNLWPLGLYHGWLGVFYYYWILGRDPWAETFLGQP